MLLILAGVAINFALGENGILKGAEYAVDKYQNKAEQEQNELAQIDDYIQNGRETITVDKKEYEQLLKDVAELKTNAIRFPNYNRVLTTIKTQGASWTATEDCVIIGILRVVNHMGAGLYVNSIGVSAITNQSANSSSVTAISINEYVEKGSVVTTRENYGEYDLTVYALK